MYLYRKPCMSTQEYSVNPSEAGHSSRMPMCFLYRCIGVQEYLADKKAHPPRTLP